MSWFDRDHGLPEGCVVVTGATSGVGRSIVRRLAGRGARIALLARSDEALEATVAEVEWLGGSAVAVPIDVADYQQVAAAAQRAEDELGAIGLWVNNAMTTVFSPFIEYEADEYERVMRVTYLGTVWGTHVALRHMLARDRGVIIQVGSALAYRGIPYQSAYCGSKHAMKGFTESVRSELLHRGSGIHVGMVHLPAVNTPQFSHCRSKFDRHPQPVPPIYQPEVAAEGVEIAVRRRRREIYLGFPTIKAVVGNKVSSALLDKILARQGPSTQLTDDPPSPYNREGNLFEPIPRDPGAHGAFDAGARTISPTLWISEHRGALSAGALGAAVAVFLGRR